MPLDWESQEKLAGERPEVALLDGGEGTARETRRRLAAANLLREGAAPGTVVLENSRRSPEILELCRHLLAL